MKWFYALLPFSFPLILLAVVLIFLLCTRPSPEPPAAGPSIYITRTDRAVTIDRKPLWILEYTVDGVLQTPAFTSREAMARYAEYLETIGEVYQREEE
jgi:hypothetical protein